MTPNADRPPDSGIGASLPELAAGGGDGPLLRQAEWHFEELAESLAEGVWVAEASTRRVLYASPRFREITGLDHRDLQGGAGDLAARVHPDDRDRVAEAWKRQASAPHAVEYRLPAGPGETRWVRERGAPLRDDRGEVRCLVGTLEDITDRVRAEEASAASRAGLEARVTELAAELKEARAALDRAEALASVAPMMSGLWHECRNALQRSQACLEMLNRKLRDQPALTMLVTEARKAQHDLQKAYQSLRVYIGAIRIDASSHAVAECWQSAWKDLALQWEGREVRLVDDGVPFDLHWPVDALYMRLVFRHIFENALAACPDPLEIRVAAAVRLTGPAPVLEVSVTDNGPGLDEEQSRRIFEPFYTTRAKGTGLGMAVVRRIVEGHGGTVTARNQPGCGLRVDIALPCPPT